MRTTLIAVLSFALVTISSKAHSQFTRFLDGSSLPGDNGWTVDGDPGVIVNLGGGNFGIQQTDADAGAGSYDEYYLTITDASNTLAARFRVDSYSYSDTPFDPLALTTGGGEASPAISVGIRNIGGQDRWALLRFIQDSNSPGTGTLLDIAPVVVGEFNEALIHIDRTTDLVRFSWNGTELYNAVTPTDHSGEGFPEFGASNFWSEGGTSTVTYDWVGYGPNYVPESGTLTLAVLGGLILLLWPRGKRCIFLGSRV